MSKQQPSLIILVMGKYFILYKKFAFEDTLVQFWIFSSVVDKSIKLTLIKGNLACMNKICPCSGIEKLKKPFQYL